MYFEGIKNTDRMFTEALQTGEPDPQLQAVENVPQLSGRWRSSEWRRLWKLMAFGKRKKSFLCRYAAAEEVQRLGSHRVKDLQIFHRTL